MGKVIKMQDEVKMIYIQMLDEDYMMLSSDQNNLRNRMYHKHAGTVIDPGPRLARKILRALTKGVANV
jgi:hypothetical protein